jgi:hypothetical protein
MGVSPTLVFGSQIQTYVLVFDVCCAEARDTPTLLRILVLTRKTPSIERYFIH